MSNFESLLVFLLIGLIAGWLAGVFVKGRGFGVLGDIVVGVIGAELGGWIFGKLGLSAYGFGGAILMAFVGAVVLLAIIKLVRNVGSAAAVLILPFLLVAFNAQAATTVVVDDNDRVSVSQTQPIIVQPVVVAVVDNSLDFHGEIEKIDSQTRTLDVIDAEGRTRQVFVTQETADAYRVGDFVTIRPMAGVREVTFIREEKSRDLEGRIVNIDISQNEIVVRDAEARDRRVTLKQGMIGTYKVDDFVRIHLMADMKEAKMIRTLKK